MKKNIKTNRTLEQYNKRYRHHKNLLKFTKKEVEDFDRQANTIGEQYVLRNNKWWYIDGSYYQVPKALHRYWFRNLNAGAQSAICLLGAGIVATSATLPFVINHNNADEGGEVIIDPSKESEAKIEVVSKSKAGVVYKVSPKDSSKNKVTGISSVTIGNDILAKDEEYTFEVKDESVELTIKQEAFSKHSGPVRVLPEVKDVSKSLFMFDQIPGTNNCSCYIYYTHKPNLPSVIEVPTTDDTGKLTVTKIDDYAFNDSKGCELIKIPATITEIGDAAFGSSGTRYEVDPANQYFVTSDDGKMLFNKDKTKLVSYQDVSGSVDLSSLTNVTTIGNSAFEGTEITDITLPNTIKEIEYSAFCICKSLTSIVLPEGLQKLGSYAFYDCESLASITFPTTITEIDKSCFYDCSALEEVVINNKYVADLPENDWDEMTFLFSTNPTVKILSGITPSEDSCLGKTFIKTGSKDDYDIYEFNNIKTVYLEAGECAENYSISSFPQSVTTEGEDLTLKVINNSGSMTTNLIYIMRNDEEYIFDGNFTLKNGENNITIPNGDIFWDEAQSKETYKICIDEGSEPEVKTLGIEYNEQSFSDLKLNLSYRGEILTEGNAFSFTVTNTGNEDVSFNLIIHSDTLGKDIYTSSDKVLSSGDSETYTINSDEISEEDWEALTNGENLTVRAVPKEQKTVLINEYVFGDYEDYLSVVEESKTTSITQGGNDLTFIVNSTADETITADVFVYAWNEEEHYHSTVVYSGQRDFAPNTNTPIIISNSDIDWEKVPYNYPIIVWIN